MGSFVICTFHSQPPGTRHRNSPKYKEHKRGKKRNHIVVPAHKPTKTLPQYKAGKKFEKYTGRRATHNYYTHIKRNKTFRTIAMQRSREGTYVAW
jgi:hypothetical protein